MISPEQAITQAPVGTMIWGAFQIDDYPREIALLVKEKSRYITQLGLSPTLEIRTAAFVEREAVVIAVMLKFNSDMLYETWVNAHDDAGGREALDLLATQSRIPVIWYSAKRERQIAIPNRMQMTFANFASMCDQSRTWTNPEFEAARNRVYARYSTPAKLWQQLRNAKP